MRQRKVKDLEERISEYGRCLAENCEELKGGWAGAFGNDNAVYIEIGSGKGDFLLKQAGINCNRNYIGFEGRRSVMFRALEKFSRTDILNVRFSCQFVNDPEEFFAEGEVSGIYLNFSDPWPKKRHEKRRLTHRDYLSAYHKILGPAGFIEMKTDNDGLFDFTLAEVDETGLFGVSEITRDLACSALPAKCVTTEYEEKFMAAGAKIKHLILIKHIE